jgi:ribosomal protein S18 acetylase RimI-like enzyme
MIVCNWRTLPADVLTPLYQSESDRWREALAWDTSSSWQTVELARTTWGLPGLVCMSPAGEVRGWTFYMTPGHHLDVGGLSAATPDATAALVDALIARAGSPAHLQGLVYASAPELLAILRDRSVPMVPYSYRIRPLASRVSPRDDGRASAFLRGEASTVRSWTDADIDDTGDLLREAHGDAAGLVAPNATTEGWRDYVRNMALHGGCGTLSPEMSRVVRVGGRLGAVSLVSTIAPQTAHLVQLSVRPYLQGRGIGRALLAAALDAAHASGHSAMTLLVSEDNVRALRLYQESGFVERGTFVSLRAVSDEPAAASAASRIA